MGCQCSPARHPWPKRLFAQRLDEVSVSNGNGRPQVDTVVKHLLREPKRLHNVATGSLSAFRSAILFWVLEFWQASPVNTPTAGVMMKTSMAARARRLSRYSNSQKSGQKAFELLSGLAINLVLLVNIISFQARHCRILSAGFCEPLANATNTDRRPYARLMQRFCGNRNLEYLNHYHVQNPIDQSPDRKSLSVQTGRGFYFGVSRSYHV